MASTVNYEVYLASIYYDPSHAGAYGGVEKLYRAVRRDGKFVLGSLKIRNWLLKQEDYAVHRETRSKFKRRRVVAPFVDYRWDMDTANMVFYEKYNDDYSYFFLAIDILSKFLWTVPQRTTTGQEMVEDLRQMFATGRKPSHIRSDQGPEFLNKNVKTFLKTEKCDIFRDSQLRAVQEAIYNVLKGNCPIDVKLKKKLEHHKSIIRRLVSKVFTRQQQQRLLTKHRAILPLILKSVIDFLSKTK